MQAENDCTGNGAGFFEKIMPELSGNFAGW
jgi:hypothetical protein